MVKKTSLLAAIVITLVLFVLKFLSPDWKRDGLHEVLVWDNAGYYAYLPAIFIYDDLETLAFADSLNVKYPMAPSLYFLHGSPIGKRYIMYPSGLAILYAPFFFAAHASAHVFGYPPDGYSLPYEFFISWGSFLYGILGLWILRRVLQRYFSEAVTALTLLIIVCGTNLFLYLAYCSYIVHVPNLFVLSVVLLYTVKWHENPGLKKCSDTGRLAWTGYYSKAYRRTYSICDASVEYPE